MPVTLSNEATVHDLHGARFASYAAPHHGSHELCAWRVEINAGVLGQPHVVSREEVLLVLTGHAVATIASEPHHIGVGDVAVVPAGATFQLDNPGTERFSAWVTTSVGLEARLADGTVVSPPWVR